MLASASPRRLSLLRALGVPFTVEPSGIEEVASPGLAPAETAVALALAKARAVASRWERAGGDRPGQEGLRVVLGADTLVLLDGRVYGKPSSPEEARAMLRSLRGRTHAVITGVAVVRPAAGAVAGSAWTAAVESRVTMRAVDDAEVEAYVRTGECDDKAGAYAAQGEGARLLAGVDGCFSNVVGLPLRTTARLLRAAGLPAVDPPDDRPVAGPSRSCRWAPLP